MVRAECLKQTEIAMPKVMTQLDDRLTAFIEAQTQEYSLTQEDILTNTPLWKDICQVLFMSKEFIYIG